MSPTRKMGLHTLQSLLFHIAVFSTPFSGISYFLLELLLQHGSILFRP